MSLRHPHIVTFIGTFTENTEFYIVTEYLEKKSLKHVLVDKKIELTINDKLQFCYDISLALYYLHSRQPQVLHRDLKSSNCLVDKHNRVKLCDFGISKYIVDRDNSYEAYKTDSIGTSFWMAPEFIKDQIFTEKADIYAFGILMWEIMMRDPVPYKDISEIAYVFGGDEELLKKRPHIPKEFDSDIKALIENCWEYDSKNRPNIKTVIDKLHSLLQKY